MEDSDRHKTGFADLPYELRQQIYFGYFLDALATDPEIELYRLGLMRMGGQVSREAAKAAISAIHVILARVQADCAVAHQNGLNVLASMNAAYKDVQAGKMTWYEHGDLRDGLLDAEDENLHKEMRLDRAVKRLEERLRRLKKTAARTPKECRGGELDASDSLGVGVFQ